MVVTLDPAQINSEEILELVYLTGMDAIPWEERTLEPKGSFYELYGREILTGLSGLFLVLRFASHYYHHPNILDIIGYFGFIAQMSTCGRGI